MDQDRGKPWRDNQSLLFSGVLVCVCVQGGGMVGPAFDESGFVLLVESELTHTPPHQARSFHRTGIDPDARAAVKASN